MKGKSNEVEFGMSIALSTNGEIVSIGGRKNDIMAPTVVRVFELDPSASSWIQLGSDMNSEESIDPSGVSVSISANGEIVAFSSNGMHGNNCVRVFQRDTASVFGDWSQIGSDLEGKNGGDEVN